MKPSLLKRIIYPVLLTLIVIVLVQCTSAPEWQKTNKQLIKQYGLTGRKLSGLPKTGIVSNLEAGKVTSLDNISNTALYPGVNAKLYWGTGTMAGILQLDPGVEVPEEILTVDRFVFVLEGEIDQLIEGETVKMISIKREEPDGTHSLTPRIDFLYLEKGSKSALKAGPEGAKLLEVYSPVRIDYLEKAGITDIVAESKDLNTSMEPNVTPNTVYDLYNFQKHHALHELNLQNQVRSNYLLLN